MARIMRRLENIDTVQPVADPLAQVAIEDNLAWVLEDAARRHGSRNFLQFDDVALSFDEVDRWANRVANGLQALSVGHGDRVAIMLENCPEFVLAWFGANKLGAVEVSVNTAYQGMSLRYILEQCGASVLIVAADFLGAVEPELESLPSLRSVVVVGTPPSTHASGLNLISWSDFESYSDSFNSQVSPIDVSMFGYTSGTTGPSKGVMVPHNRIVKTGRDAAMLRGINPDDTLMTCLPLFHGNAKYHTVLPALAVGCRAVLTGRFSASRFWSDIRRYKATQFNYLGVMISILLKSEPGPKDHEHAVRLAFGAGAGTTLLEKFEQRFGVFLMEAYGLTEGGVALANRRDDRRLGSCGKPMPGYEVEVVDAWDNPVSPGTEGELVLRSRRPYTTMLGYYRMPEETAQTYRNFWLHTGDLARKDTDGFFYFVDRKKDAIRRRGENISTFEIEAVVNSHPEIVESAAYAVPAEVGEDDVMVTAVLREGSHMSVDELHGFCLERMPYFWVPRYIDLSEEPLPRTPTNKIEKYKLRQTGVRSGTWDADRSGATTSSRRTGVRK